MINLIVRVYARAPFSHVVLTYYSTDIHLKNSHRSLELSLMLLVPWWENSPTNLYPSSSRLEHKIKFTGHNLLLYVLVSLMEKMVPILTYRECIYSLHFIHWQLLFLFYKICVGIANLMISRSYLSYVATIYPQDIFKFLSSFLTT